MEVSVENTGSLERRMTVQVAPEDIQKRVEGRIKDLGKQVKLKGFRPGKIPYKVLEQRYGLQVRKEVVDEVIQETFAEAVSSERLRIATTPQISSDDLASGAGHAYTATFEVFPEMSAIDVASLKLSRPTAHVGDGDVAEMIETLRIQRRTWHPLERPAQSGDMVVFENTVTVGDQQFPEQGPERSGVILGSGALPDVEKAVEGAATGDERSVKVTLPDDFKVKEVAGKKGTMQIKILQVSEDQMPDVDEEFIKSFGVPDGSREGLDREVRGNLERELEQAIRQKMKEQVLDKLLVAHESLEVPPGLLDEETQRLKDAAARQEGAPDPESTPVFAFAERAQRNIAGRLLFSEVARQNGLTVDQARVGKVIDALATTYEDADEVKNLYYRNPQLLRNVENTVLEDQVVEWVCKHAQVTDSSSSFEEILKPVRDHEAPGV